MWHFKRNMSKLTQIISCWIEIRLNIVVKWFEDIDGVLDADAAVQDVVLAIVRPQKLVHNRRSKRTHPVDQLEQRIKFCKEKES